MQKMESEVCDGDKKSDAALGGVISGGDAKVEAVLLTQVLLVFPVVSVVLMEIV